MTCAAAAKLDIHPPVYNGYGFDEMDLDVAYNQSILGDLRRSRPA